MLMLLMRRVEHFDNPQPFQEWHERHAQILYQNLSCHVKMASEVKMQWELDGKQVSTKQIQLQLKTRIEALCNDYVRKTWWRSCEDDYLTSLENLQSMVRNIANGAASTCADLHDAGDYLPFAHPINVVLYERLICCCFDRDGDLDEYYHPRVIAALKYLRTSLGITEAIHTIAWTKIVFLKYLQNPDETRLTLFREYLPQVVAAVNAQVEGYNYFHRAAVEYGLLVLERGSEHFVTRLSSYHRNFSKDIEGLRAELEVMFQIKEIKTGKAVAGGRSGSISEETKRETAEQLIEASISNWYNALLDDYICPLGLEDAFAVAEAVCVQVDTEANKFSPLFKPYHPSPATVGLRQLIRSFSPTISETLKLLPTLDKESAVLLHKLKELADNVTAHDEELAAELDLVAMTRRVVSKWVGEQRERLRPFIESCIRLSVWEPLKPPEKLHAKSIVDLFGLFETSLDAFGDMSIPHSEAFLKPLVKGFCDAIDDYCGFATHSSRVIPEPRKPPPISREKEKESLGKLLSEEEEADFERNKIPLLCVRLNSLAYASDQIDVVREKMLAINPQSPVSLLENAQHSCKNGCGEIRKYIAARTIFSDLQGPLLKGLYVPTVEDSRMKSVLDSFEATLGTLYQMVCDSQKEPVVTDVFATFMMGFEFALMHGGIKRIFKFEHFKLFAQDLQVLKDFFGEGLPPKVVEACSHYLDALLKQLFARPSKELIEEYQMAKEFQSGTVVTKYNIFRVLRHRSKTDTAAKKFIRKFKMSNENRRYIKSLGEQGPAASGR